MALSWLPNIRNLDKFDPNYKHPLCDSDKININELWLIEIIIDNSSVKTVRKYKQVLIESDKTLAKINNSQLSKLFDERHQNILQRQKIHLRSKAKTENTIEPSLFLTRSFIFVQMRKQHLHAV